MARKPTYEELEQRVNGIMAYTPKILIVDDDPGFCDSLKVLLSNQGYQMQTSSSGKEAVKYLVKYNFDLVLLDIVLPEMNGHQIMGFINSKSPETLVIVITGHASTESATESLRRGAYDYLKKPFKPEELLTTVENALDRKRLERDSEMAKEALRDSEEKYRLLVETMNDGLAVMDENMLITYVNNAICQMMGYDPKELIGNPVSKFLDEANQRILKEQFDRRKRGEQDTYEISFTRKDKKKVPAICSPQPIFDSEDRFRGSFVVITDITERKLAEEQLKASLKEKEVLLKEIHHRVKNNLQIISSLLDMSRRRSENQEAIDLLSEAGAKIHTMALIHTQLYQSGRFDQIDMQSHIQDMIIHLSHLYGAKENITPIINASGVYLSVTRAIPCALALNELISNVYRHAFQQGEEGTVEVSMEQSSDGTISLKIKDDGIGIPEEIDINETDTLGLKLVRNLVLGQLKGKLQIERKDGTEILIEFRALEEEE